jgi:hypothetical protein
LAVSFLLEPLLQSLACPFAPFFQDFHLYFAQRARPIIIRGHRSFRKVNGCSSRMRNQLRPHHYRGSVKMLSGLHYLHYFPCIQPEIPYVLGAWAPCVRTSMKAEK